ncbi:MAG: hypothetical protein BAA04_08655 [Firmicutes bacterium ZCTH02-B6]|nr:MAG: hypothetical protein BAA04_08655 [Firmicutes bacterium ZCTH02-B6]
MPQMGFDMQEGTLVRWLKQPGDQVQRGEAIAEVETDKAVVEIESFHTGVVKELLVAEGTTVPVGTPIAVIDAGDEADTAQAETEATPRPAAPADPAVAAPAPGMPAHAGAATGPAAVAPASVAPSPRVQDGTRRPKASPLARRLASEYGVSLQGIVGSGPGGRIVKQDVLAAVTAMRSEASGAAAAPMAPATAPVGPAAPAPAVPVSAAQGSDALVPMSRMRQTIARRMAESKQQAPHFYVTMAIEMDQAMALREQLKQLPDVPPVSVNDLILKATAIALTRHPRLNSSLEGDAIRVHGAVHLAMAVALEEGLITPVIRDCHNKSLVEIAREARELAEAARAGRLKPEQYQGGTFTVSNLGMFGVEEFAAIINPPQAAILAVGAVTEQPVVRNGQLAVGRIMRATVSADHRVTDGAQVALFLQDLKAILENPLRLLV